MRWPPYLFSVSVGMGTPQLISNSLLVGETTCRIIDCLVLVVSKTKTIHKTRAIVDSHLNFKVKLPI